MKITIELETDSEKNSLGKSELARYPIVQTHVMQFGLVGQSRKQAGIDDKGNPIFLPGEYPFRQLWIANKIVLLGRIAELSEALKAYGSHH